MGKPCGTMDPEDIPIRMLTHVFFSFGFISPGTFQIENMADFQPSLFGRVTDLKMNNPDLKVLIALGVRSSRLSILLLRLVLIDLRAGLIMTRALTRKSSRTWPPLPLTARSSSGTSSDS